MISEIAFVGIPVTDIARARKFYEGVLGLKPTHDIGNWIEYDIGAGTLGVGIYEGWQPSSQGTCAALEVDDFPATMAKLKKQGVTITMEAEETPVCHLAIIADPDGNKILIHKRKAK